MSEKIKGHLPGFDNLAPLQSIDPKIFVSDDKDDQDVCNFILTLCIALNDAKDVFWAISYLKRTPPQSSGINRFRGQHAGFQHHLNKTIFSILWEIIDLFKKRKDIFEKKLFKKIFSQLDKRSKEHWNEVFKISAGKSVKYHKLLEKFRNVRNRVAWHYKDNLENYERSLRRIFLTDNGDVKQKAYVSIGRNAEQTRFYFTDSIVQELILPPPGSDEFNDFDSELEVFLEDIHVAITTLVWAFIPAHEGSYWEESDH